MKNLIGILLIFATLLNANQQNDKKKTEDTKIENACILGDSTACNLLGNLYFDTSTKEANTFLGIILHNKACKANNQESCKILDDFKNKNYKSILNENELKIFSSLVKEELSMYLKDNEHDTVFNEYYKPKRNHIATTSNKIQLDYEKNEVAADLNYKDKDIVVAGEVLKISKNAFDSIYLDLKGGSNQFMTPKAIIEKEFIEWASKLSKKDKVNLFCKKSSMIMGSVTLDNCKPINAIIDERAINIIESIDKSSLQNLNNDWLKTGVIVKEVSKLLKNDSKCYSSNDELSNCINEISSVLLNNKKKFGKINELIK